MPQPKQGDRGDSSDGVDSSRRRTRRKRTVLNLGMPFFPIDDFVNQSEDAVALGYRVLEETIEEIKNGYREARRFNAKQREYEEKLKDYERGKGPAPVAPAIPWEELVDRVQKFQTIAFNAFSEGTELAFDSIRSGTRSTRRLAKTWSQSREDIETRPMLAGPVFEDPVEIVARAGGQAGPVALPIRHKGLTRLRINAVVDPLPFEILRPRRKSAKSMEGQDPDDQKVQRLTANISVSFEPATDLERYDDATSILTVRLGTIPERQKPGIYEGFIRASNFELLIARLRIRVLKAVQETPAHWSA